MYDNETLEDLLKRFITGRYHMAIVRTVVTPDSGDNYYKTVGKLHSCRCIYRVAGKCGSLANEKKSSNKIIANI